MRDWYVKVEELKRDNPELTSKEIADRLGKKQELVEQALQGMKESKDLIVYEDRKSRPTAEDLKEYYNALKNLNNTLDELDTRQTKMSITIDDNKPIAIAYSGDWHEGARGVDYELFDQDRDILRSTEGLYVVGMGDYKENQSPYIHADGVNQQTASPGLQDLLVINHVSELKNKWIAMVCGCHDYWDKKIGDKDFITTLTSEDVGDCVNLWHGGGINLKLGDQTYKMWVRHKYLGESSLNTTNTHRRLIDAFGPADVVAVAHKHYPDMQMRERMGQKTVYLRSGTYKSLDEFGQRIGGYTGQPGVPVVVLYPDQKKVVPFIDLKDGVTHLKAVRGRFKRSQSRKKNAKNNTQNKNKGKAADNNPKQGKLNLD